MRTQAECKRVNDESYTCRQLFDELVEKDIADLHSREEINRKNIDYLKEDCTRL